MGRAAGAYHYRECLFGCLGGDSYEHCDVALAWQGRAGAAVLRQAVDRISGRFQQGEDGAVRARSFGGEEGRVRQAPESLGG